MKEITLAKIGISDFRGIRSLECAFGPDTVIEGDNATGKSSIFAAFTWCLFGKDEKDRKDFEIKPAKDGNPIGRTRTCVTVTLDVDGEPAELKREYYEKWVRHTGDDQDTYEGNETACWWNGAPVSVTEYGRRVAGIIDPQMFKMLTNPAFFPTMKWKDQRDILLRLVPEATDEELAAGDKDIAAMLGQLSGKTAKDFRAEKAAALKKLRAEKDAIDPRIDEVRKAMKDTSDTEDRLNAEIAKAEQEAESARGELASLSKSQEAVLKEMEAKRKEISDIESKAAQLVNDAKLAERQRVLEANMQRTSIAAEISSLELKASGEKNYIESFIRQTALYMSERDSLKEQHAALSAEYLAESSKTFDPKGMTCPTCGRPMTKEQITAAEEEFNAAKASRLAAIVEKGTKLKDGICAADRQISEREEKLEALTEECNADNEKVLHLKEQMVEMPEAETERETDPESVPGWNGLQLKIAELRKEMRGLEAGCGDTESRSEASARLKACMERIGDCRASLSDIDANRKAEARVAELVDRGRELAQQIADLERLELAAQRLEKLRFEDVERKVNGLFHNVRFKLFDYTIEGKAVDTCTAVVGDAPYPVANSAGKLNAGLDIIHTLSEHFGYRCPIFIDNAEGVTSIDGRGMQLVRMYVAKGSKLTVTNNQVQ